MASKWTASNWRARVARTSMWSAELVGDELLVSSTGDVDRHSLAQIDSITARHGLLSSRIELSGVSPLHLKRLSRRDARDLHETVERERERVLAVIRLAELAREFEALCPLVADWARGFFAAAKAHHRDNGWLTAEFTATWEQHKPVGRFAELLAAPELEAHRRELGGEALQAIELWSSDLAQYVARWNDRFLDNELVAYKSFFDNVERSPLTDEQSRAVVCFDNRVQLVAAAGSGKTSTMIAKAGYAVHRGLVAPEQILMLAFNSKAAAELQERVTERLAPLGLAADRIVARTFHSFGLALIGQATGRKPRLAPWIEQGGDIEKLARIVDELRDADVVFRTNWDLFRMVFGRDLPEFGQEQAEPDGWDPVARREGHRTLAGEVVKSQAERLIADWLYYNGVSYRYEQRYEVDTADAEHSQYHPDFYYPDINLYHEHFALDEQGIPPEEFVGYLDGVHWKRALHAEHGTALIETTMAELWNGKAFAALTEQLSYRGLVLDPNPDRPALGQPPIDNKRLIATFRSFMVHAKSNRLSVELLRERAREGSTGKFLFRHEKFLELYRTIEQRWQEELTAHDSIDFEDMLNLAADHAEAGWKSPFRLVMVDELQDVSAARARLARALVTAPGHYLFAVGDDWQSINRFTGADLSVMTKFEEWFGKGETLRLERTFRCPQPICDVSSGFVLKNPQQISKQVLSSTPEHPPAFLAIAANNDDHVQSVIRKHLAELNDRIATGLAPGGRGGKASVFILGRYRHQESLVPHGATKQWAHLDVRFSTIHASKGLEADYVVIPGLTKDKSSFPSKIADDPVLRLAMPAREPFPYAEERRLFYVAITRARRSVTLVTVRNRVSPFLAELVKDHGLKLRDAEGGYAVVIPCPACGEGTMVPRAGKFGQFYGCTNYPKCRNTMKEAEAAGHNAAPI
ncbi:UvrD-helicase domain-containing protein [Salinibacterium sp. SWN139]|uniref:UvrD-helicase domain-containing protein n=1 Tax=Salinibacterium sp. SWN139 TaxID=2792055 RepID=UPI0018CF8C7C|nr:UvrD-helicase domain-containing protein [Salinibacterium sp. SWN139]MBH0052700.1 UvrD-helicase domain-containing protein [Salinibacterium sp. SWN139]